jgi:hypothetical protein
VPAFVSPSGIAGSPPQVEIEPNDTLNAAQMLALPALPSAVSVTGTLGGAADGAADVDWYSFRLDRPSDVHLNITTPGGSSLTSVLSLYNTDPTDFQGHRQLVQDDGANHGGNAVLDRTLAPGTYYVAVSGHGNNYFNPFLAGSGFPGSTGPYELDIRTTDPGLVAGDGPAVLSADPGPSAVLNDSPLVLRVDLSSPLDPDSLQPGQTVRLTYHPSGTVGTGNDQDIELTANYSGPADEIQLTPAAPLAPGVYQLFLAGKGGTGQPVLTDPNGIPLGADAGHPLGQNQLITFEVNGIEGTTGAVTADDTGATAHPLGDLTNAGMVQVAGAIGDDPTDPIPFDPADVDMYSFHVSGPGRHAVGAEVFAGRIGSPLDPGVSLFRVDPTTHRLTLVAANDDTQNASVAANGTLPLYNDAALFAGVTAGDYYLAVSGGDNTPDPLADAAPGVDGVFDPNVSHSGQVGSSTGDYVMNVLLTPADTPPRVVSVTPGTGDVLDAPPTQLVVRFSNTVNLQALALESFDADTPGQLAPVFIQGDAGRYLPRLESFDPTTNQAVFLMTAGLPNGTYQLHLSGPLGLTDLAGNPLQGNEPDGDYVVPFTVHGPARGSNGDPQQWLYQSPGPGRAAPQNLGVLFPDELQGGVSITHEVSGALKTMAAASDAYQFQVLQSREYIFLLQGAAGSPPGPGLSVTLLDAAGRIVPTTTEGDGQGVKAVLSAGVYVARVAGWAGGYQVTLSLGGAGENPIPLTVGPAPALTLQLLNSAPPPVAIVPPRVVLSAPTPVPTATTPADPSVVIAPAVVPGEVRIVASKKPAGRVDSPPVVVPVSGATTASPSTPGSTPIAPAIDEDATGPAPARVVGPVYEVVPATAPTPESAPSSGGQSPAAKKAAVPGAEKGGTDPVPAPVRLPVFADIPVNDLLALGARPFGGVRVDRDQPSALAPVRGLGSQERMRAWRKEGGIAASGAGRSDVVAPPLPWAPESSIALIPPAWVGEAGRSPSPDGSAAATPPAPPEKPALLDVSLPDKDGAPSPVSLPAVARLRPPMVARRWVTIIAAALAAGTQVLTSLAIRQGKSNLSGRGRKERGSDEQPT